MCGIFGISGHDDAARLTHLGLYSLQHRGQESAGIVAVKDGVAHGKLAMGLMGSTGTSVPLITFAPVLHTPTFSYFRVI